MASMTRGQTAPTPTGPTLLGRVEGPSDSIPEKTSAPASFYALEWAQASERFTDTDALVFDGVGSEHRFTFRELEMSANRLAWKLASMGIGVGDRVVTIAENRPEMVLLFLSCLKLGATFVPLATDLRPQDCRGMVARYEPSLIVCDQPQYAPFEREGGGEYLSILLPPFEVQDNALKRMCAEGRDHPFPVPEVPAGVPSTIFSTSGSTALPKGVMYSHAVLAGLGAANWSASPHAEHVRSTHLMWVSMRGVAGTLMLLRHLLQGSLTVMADAYPSGPKLWGELMDKHAIDSHILFGAAMNQTLQEFPHRTFESVRTILYGGSCFAPTLIQRSMEQFPNASFVQGYGMTEVSPISLLGAHFHKRTGIASEADLRRMSSAGQVPVPGNVFIEDLDQPGSGRAPPDEKDGIGQVCARSSVTMMGYYADAEKTREAMPDGEFVRTGDIGRLDEDGFLHILGRVKDIIPTHRGFNVAPRDLEEILYSHPQVGQACVVGAWHPSGAGEAVVAWARAKAGAQLSADELRRHLEQSGTPSWQSPDAIHICHKALPTTGGKIDAKAFRVPAFRQAQVVAELTVAWVRAGVMVPLPAEDGADDCEALVAAICTPDLENFCERKLAAIFGEEMPMASSLLGAGSAVGREDLLSALRAMTCEEYDSFQLQVRSLLGNWAASKVV